MSLEENKAIIRRRVEAYNKRNLAVLDELVSSDFLSVSTYTILSEMKIQIIPHARNEMEEPVLGAYSVKF